MKRWPIAQKCRIVEETFVPGTSVAIVARRNDVNTNQVFGWRKQYRQGTLVDKKARAMAALPAPELARIGVVDHGGVIRPLPVSVPSVPAPHEPGKVTQVLESRPPGLIEIELRGGIKVRVDTCIDEAALRRVLAVIKESA
jgi:transposase